MTPDRRTWIARHPAAAARVATFGVGAAGMLTLMAVFARHADQSPADSRPSRIEVRIGDEVDTDELRQTMERWLEGDPDLDREGGLRVVQAPPDTATVPS